MSVRIHYDPFNREEAARAEAEQAAREEHQQWSLEQSRKGNDATRRESAGTWLKLMPDLPEQETR